MDSGHLREIERGRRGREGWRERDDENKERVRCTVLRLLKGQWNKYETVLLTDHIHVYV